MFDLYAKVTLDDSEYSKGIGEATSKGQSFATSLKKGLATAGTAIAKGTALAVGAAATATAALGKIGFDYNKEMESYQTNFEVLLGSYEEGVAKTEELKDMAASTPFSMSDLASGTQTLLAFGVASEDSTDILSMLGDISLGDADKLGRLTTAFGKANSLGKLTGETYQQMVEAGFNPLAVISEKTGESMEELQDRMAAGKISAEELTEAMETATSEGGQFADGMLKASQTTEGLISTLEDNARALVGSVFQPITDAIQSELLPGAIDAVAQLQDAFDNGGVSGLIEAGGEMFSGLVGAFSKKLPTLVTTALQIVQQLVNALLQNAPALATAAMGIVVQLATFIIQNLPLLVQAALDVIVALSNGLAEALPELIPTIVDVVLTIVETLIDNVGLLIDASVALMVGLTEGLINALPVLIQKIPDIVIALVKAYIENAPKMLEAGTQLIVLLGEGILNTLVGLYSSVSGWVDDNIVQPIKDKVSEFFGAGQNLIIGLWNGISDKIGWLKSQVKGLVDKIKSWFTGKDGFDEHSPSKWGRGVGTYLTYGVGGGIEDGASVAVAAAANMVDRVKNAMSGIGVGTAYGLTSGQTSGGVQIVQNIASVPQTPVELAAATAAYFEQARWT